jgi:hypothetical protein
MVKDKPKSYHFISAAHVSHGIICLYVLSQTYHFLRKTYKSTAIT